MFVKGPKCRHKCRLGVAHGMPAAKAKIFQSREKRRIIYLLPRSPTLPSAIFLQESSMSNHVYKSIELTGSSTKNIEDAVSPAIAKASTSVRNIDWFEVIETRGTDGILYVLGRG